jgi:hypothetical protein
MSTFEVLLTTVVAILTVIMLIIVVRRARHDSINRFRDEFRELFGFEAPTSDVETTKLELQVAAKLREVGGFQRRIQESASAVTQRDANAGLLQYLLAGANAALPSGSVAQYKRMRSLAIQAGFRRKMLDEIQAELGLDQMVTTSNAVA